jgi:hypothetical protein|tara:strand:- start:75 stop:176 length:102 start_codon:yes stop_codon:yes gene_type:complete
MAAAALSTVTVRLPAQMLPFGLTSSRDLRAGIR